jgi:poly(hydroxyalkanoate) depolymerase family esterase
LTHAEPHEAMRHYHKHTHPKRQPTKRLARLPRIALGALLAAMVALPATAAASLSLPGLPAGATTLPAGATTLPSFSLPGLPGWTGTTAWWTQLPGWSTLPGSSTPAPPPTGGSGGTGGTGGTTPLKGAAFSGTYTNSAGSRDYIGYVPSTYKSGTAVPLVVVLHGCTQSADVIRQATRFDQLAEAKGFITVFPEQPKSANQFKCWNFFQDAQMHRGSAEPSLIAGITNWVQQHYTIDSKRVYVTGLSAGGAMASVMGATYPDVYAAIGIGSGCEYDASATCAGYQSTDPTQAAQAAYTEMGSRARPLPVIAFQGDKDTTVPPINADQLVAQWRGTAQLAGDSTTEATTQMVNGTTPGGRTYTVHHYVDGNGKELVEYWVVHGMNHAWSGGCGCEQYTDPAGPDATAATYAFFMSHPMP